MKTQQLANSKKLTMYVILGLLTALTFPTVFASTTGAEFQAAYDFIFGAATGYLGRAIAIAGGLIGLAIGAGTGRPIVAVIGIVLAILGALGPTIINSIFGSALI